MSTQTWVETLPQRSPVLSEQDWWVGMRALPTLPSVLFRFLGLVGDPKVGTEELADFIWKDPALLTRALPLVASTWSRPEEATASLHKGIVGLNRERIRNLAFTTPLLRSFEPLGTGSYAITYWERSLLCATASQAAAWQLKLADPERYYVAGLLHDIGYLVLLQKRPTILPAILQQWSSRPLQLLEIEDELMGIDHCRLGLQVAARLGLEPWIYPAIGAHHTPAADSEPICKITAIGAAFANYQGVDFFPRRSLSRSAREREMHEIIRVLLPEHAEPERQQLFEVMEKAVRPIRNAVRETIVEWQVAGESRIQPHFARSVVHLAAVPAIA
jgi:HD-like signal output (HDOD) protein